MYNAIIFDLDDTLMDFKKTENVALEATFAAYDVPLTTERRARYEAINRQLWHEIEQGTMTQQQLRSERFIRLFAEEELAIDGRLVGDEYVAQLGKTVCLIDGAVDVCRALSERYPLLMITNGIADVQHPRLEQSPLAPLFTKIIVSETVGISKPNRAIFQLAIDEYGSDLLMVGDSQLSDIDGAQRAGLATCWFNYRNEAKRDDVTATYTIEKLTDLLQVLIGK